MKASKYRTKLSFCKEGDQQALEYWLEQAIQDDQIEYSQYKELQDYALTKGWTPPNTKIVISTP